MFLLGVICGVLIGVVFMSAKPKNKDNQVAVKADTPKAQETVAVKEERGRKVAKLNIPIEVLPNLYSLSVEHPTVEHIKGTFMNGEIYEQMSIYCELHYKLNGRKEGKRFFVFSYYDHDGNVFSHKQTPAFRLTDSGIEMVQVHGSLSWDNLPAKIGVSVQEA